MARRAEGRSCSFCGKKQEQVRRVIAGPGGLLICNECVALCARIMSAPNQGAGAAGGTESPWWRRGLAAVRRAMHGRRRRLSWQGTVGQATNGV